MNDELREVARKLDSLDLAAEPSQPPEAFVAAVRRRRRDRTARRVLVVAAILAVSTGVGVLIDRSNPQPRAHSAPIAAAPVQAPRLPEASNAMGIVNLPDGRAPFCAADGCRPASVETILREI